MAKATMNCKMSLETKSLPKAMLRAVEGDLIEGIQVFFTTSGDLVFTGPNTDVMKKVTVVDVFNKTMSGYNSQISELNPGPMQNELKNEIKAEQYNFQRNLFEKLAFIGSHIQKFIMG